MKTVRLNEGDAAHVYEWFLGILQVAPELKGCLRCSDIAKRLTRAIGPSAARRIRKDVRDYPYLVNRQ